jgi:hypothetical protein
VPTPDVHDWLPSMNTAADAPMSRLPSRLALSVSCTLRNSSAHTPRISAMTVLPFRARASTCLLDSWIECSCEAIERRSIDGFERGALDTGELDAFGNEVLQHLSWRPFETLSQHRVSD